MRRDIEALFDVHTRDILKTQPNVSAFVLKHEAKHKCIENLCYEIRKCELGVKDFNVNDYSDVIRTVAVMFAQNALNIKEFEIMSDIQKLQFQAKQQSTTDDQLKDMGVEVIDRSQEYKG